MDHYLSLEKKGEYYYIALCPFHDDRHPSLREWILRKDYTIASVVGDPGGMSSALYTGEEWSAVLMKQSVFVRDICPPPFPHLMRDPQSYRPDKQQTPPTDEMNERYRQTLLPYDPGMDFLGETYAANEVGIAPTRLKPGNLPAAGLFFRSVMRQES